jgi:hypothetical protein
VLPANPRKGEFDVSVKEEAKYSVTVAVHTTSERDSEGQQENSRE